jgi:hypothetical protein
VHLKGLDVDVHPSRAAGDGGLEDRQVITHQRGGPFVGQAELILDDPVMGGSESKAEAPIARDLRGQRLLGHHERVAGLHGNDRRAYLDPRRTGTHEGDGRHGVDVPGNLGNPERGEAGRLGGLHVGDQASQSFAAGPIAVGADHQSQAHPEASQYVAST